MAYRSVYSVSQLKDGIRRAQRLLIEDLGILLSAESLERRASDGVEVDWPIDPETDVLMFNRATGAGPLKTIDDMLNEALFGTDKTMRYQYTVKPGRPAAYTNTRITLGEDLGGAGIAAVLKANAGTPFSSVHANAVTGDKVKVRFPYGSTWHEFPLEPVHCLFDSGRGLYFVRDSDGLTVLTNGTFTGNADSWSLGVGWSYAGNAITAAGVNTSVEQNYAELRVPLINGQRYIVAYYVSVFTAGTVTPYLGTTAGTAGGAVAPQWFAEVITCVGEDASFKLTGTAWNGTITQILVVPVYKERIFNGDFGFDAATHGWTFAGNWQYGGANHWMGDNGAAIAANTTLKQAAADFAIPLVEDTIWRVDFQAGCDAGKIRALLGDSTATYNAGPWVDAAGPASYEHYIKTPDTGDLNLEFQSDGNWEGTLDDVSVFCDEVDGEGDPEVILVQSDVT